MSGPVCWLQLASSIIGSSSFHIYLALDDICCSTIFLVLHAAGLFDILAQCLDISHSFLAFGVSVQNNIFLLLRARRCILFPTSQICLFQFQRMNAYGLMPFIVSTSTRTVMIGVQTGE